MEEEPDVYIDVVLNFEPKSTREVTMIVIKRGRATPDGGMIMEEFERARKELENSVMDVEMDLVFTFPPKTSRKVILKIIGRAKAIPEGGLTLPQMRRFMDDLEDQDVVVIRRGLWQRIKKIWENLFWPTPSPPGP